MLLTHMYCLVFDVLVVHIILSIYLAFHFLNVVASLIFYMGSFADEEEKTEGTGEAKTV